MNDPTLSLPFDQYQRYRLVTDILNDVRGEDERLSVLDVGGRTGLLRQFLPDDRVFIVDVDPSEEAGLVLGDGSRLPFADACVDAVVTFDTLEHVPPTGRAAFLAECRRVARRWVVVAGPYDTEGVADSEALLTQFLKDKLKVEHRYLAEHAAHGLPQLDETEAALSAAGAQVVSIGHANLHRWLALMCAELYLDNDAPLRGLAKKYYEYYNGSHYSSDHAGPVYRHAVVAAVGGAPMPNAKDLLGSTAAPAGTFEPVAHVLQELLSFDIQRDVIKGEWERLEEVNAGLEKDLVGHRDTLKENAEELLRQAEVCGELKVRVRSLEDGQRLQEARGTELEEAIEFHETRSKKFEAMAIELDENVRHQMQRVDDITRVGEENQARAQAAIEALEARLNEANQTIGQKQTALDTVREELTRERQTIDRLNAQLRDRWASLLRGLAIK